MNHSCIGQPLSIYRPLIFGLLLLSGTGLLCAQDAPEVVQDNDTSPYHLALLDYKRGKFDLARTEIDAAEKAKPGDLPTGLLKAKILTELHDYDNGEATLRAFLPPTAPAKPEIASEIYTALGDLLLRKHSFDRAAKYYSLALGAKPGDPDLILKLVYANVGSTDLIAAGQYASQLKPIDPKNPYDDHASYFFAKAALAQATGKIQDADDAIQNARTNYGNTITDRYLKTYLEVFAASDKGPNSDLTPAPLVKPVDPGAKP